MNSNKIELKILVAHESTRGISPADLSSLFKNVGKRKHDNKKADIKVFVTVEKVAE